MCLKNIISPIVHTILQEKNMLNSWYCLKNNIAIQIYDVNLHISIGKDVVTLYPPIERNETCSKTISKIINPQIIFSTI